MPPPVTRYEVAGRTVTTPLGVADALAASAVFLVPAEPARRWLPDHGRLALLQPVPGRGTLALTAVRYRRNQLGRYDELSVALLVRPANPPLPAVVDLLDPRRGIYVHRLPVDDAFSCAAGQTVWGLPKSVEPVTVTATADGVTCHWGAGDALVMRLSVHRRGTARLPATAQTAYSMRDGVPHRTRFVIRASGVGIGPGGARVELGTGDLADELRELGLPKAAVVSATMQRLQARFDAAMPMLTSSCSDTRPRGRRRPWAPPPQPHPGTTATFTGEESR